MPNVIVRPFEPQDQEGILRVWSLTYNNAAPFDHDSPVVIEMAQPEPPVTKFVAERDSTLVGAFGVMPMTATRGNGLMKSAGILGVAVMPQVRGGGVGGAMMRFALQHYREIGYELASLYAFRESYYRGFGYECCGKRIKLTVESARLPVFKQTLESRILEVEDVDSIRPCYESFGQTYSGVNIRSQHQWDRVLKPKLPRILYVVGNPVEAYAVVEHKVNFWIEQSIDEVAWSSLEGYESIMAVLRGVAINKSSLTWYEPSNSPYLAKYMDHGTKVQIERTPMFRVLNVPQALVALRPSSSGEFVLGIGDPDVVENNGSWWVQYGEQGVIAERTHKEPGVTLGINHFAQALLGEPSLAELMGLGLAKVNDASQATAAQRLLPAQSVYCVDFF